MRPSNADLWRISGSTGGSSQPSKAGIDVDDDAFLVRSCSVASAAGGPWPGTGAPQWHGDPGLSASSSRRQAQYSRSTEAGESAPRRRLGPATVSAITPRCSYTFKYILWNTNTHTHTRLTALFPGYPGRPVPERYKKLSYRRGTARCVVSVKILPTATQRCRNYL